MITKRFFRSALHEHAEPAQRVLGALALLAALGSIGLTAVGEATPDVLIALGSAAVGALVGLFAPSPSK